MLTRKKAAEAAEHEPAEQGAGVNESEGEPAETPRDPPTFVPLPPPPSRTRSTSSRTRTDWKVIALREAELEAARKMEEVERELIRKELELKQRTIQLRSEILSSKRRSQHSRSSTSSRRGIELRPERKERLISSNESKQTNKDTEHLDAPERSDIKLLAREIVKLINSPSDPESLPYFDGNMNHWIAFKAAYLESSPRYSDAQNVARLNCCLKGEARETVAASLHTLVPPSQILKTLELCFGRPELILLKEIRSIHEMPKINDSSDYLCKFAAKIQNYIATIQFLERPNFLHDHGLIQSIKSKMSSLKTRYLCYVEKENRSSEPELVKISKFLNYEAELSTKCLSLDVNDANINKSNLIPVKSKTSFSELTSDFCDYDEGVITVGKKEEKSPDLFLEKSETTNISSTCSNKETACKVEPGESEPEPEPSFLHSTATSACGKEQTNTDTNSNTASVNFIGHTDTQMHNMIEFLDISAKKKIHSADEKALCILDSTTRRVEDVKQRCEVGLLCRDEEFKMPDKSANTKPPFLREVERKIDEVDRTEKENFLQNRHKLENAPVQRSSWKTFDKNSVMFEVKIIPATFGAVHHPAALIFPEHRSRVFATVLRHRRMTYHRHYARTNYSSCETTQRAEAAVVYWRRKRKRWRFLYVYGWLVYWRRKRKRWRFIYTLVVSHACRYPSPDAVHITYIN